MPLTWFFRYCSAAFASVGSYALLDAGFLITLYFSAIAAVRLNAAGSITPMPFEFGQMSLLISFICQSWWPAGSAVPFLTTMFVQSWTWSRQYTQPRSEAAMNRVAMSRWPLT